MTVMFDNSNTFFSFECKTNPEGRYVEAKIMDVDRKPCPRCEGPNYTETTTFLNGGSERIAAECSDCHLWKITYPDKRVKK